MTVWYVALCRTCNDRVRCFKTVEERAGWMADHTFCWKTGHDDFWQGDADQYEH